MSVFEDPKEPRPILVDNHDNDDEDDDRSRNKIRCVPQKKKKMISSIIQETRKHQNQTSASSQNHKPFNGRSNGPIKRAVSGPKPTRSSLASSHSAAGYSCRSRGIYEVESLDLFRASSSSLSPSSFLGEIQLRTDPIIVWFRFVSSPLFLVSCWAAIHWLFFLLPRFPTHIYIHIKTSDRNQPLSSV
jgi:hypothetical protein